MRLPILVGRYMEESWQGAGCGFFKGGKGDPMAHKIDIRSIAEVAQSATELVENTQNYKEVCSHSYIHVIMPTTGTGIVVVSGNKRKKHKQTV